MSEMVGVVAVSGGLAMHLAIRDFPLVKEVFDLVFGMILLVIFSPLMLLCAVLIKFSDDGPVSFVQPRVGRYGRAFKLYKLRTMRIDAESESGEIWASGNDPRILKACRWMRISHVDELPQLLNVIKGEMSLVGPRPERREILLKLGVRYPNVGRRLVVRPGITGLAQIRAGYDTTVEEFQHKLSADLEYIEKYSFTMDIRIIAATFPRFCDNRAH